MEGPIKRATAVRPHSEFRKSVWITKSRVTREDPGATTIHLTLPTLRWEKLCHLWAPSGSSIVGGHIDLTRKRSTDRYEIFSDSFNYESSKLKCCEINLLSTMFEIGWCCKLRWIIVSPLGLFLKSWFTVKFTELSLIHVSTQNGFQPLYSLLKLMLELKDL